MISMEIDTDKLKDWFEDIADMCARLTSGNVSHLGVTIRGKAIRAAEYIDKHTIKINNKLSEKSCIDCPFENQDCVYCKTCPFDE